MGPRCIAGKTPRDKRPTVGKKPPAAQTPCPNFDSSRLCLFTFHPGMFLRARMRGRNRGESRPLSIQPRHRCHLNNGIINPSTAVCCTYLMYHDDALSRRSRRDRIIELPERVAASRRRRRIYARALNISGFRSWSFRRLSYRAGGILAT